MNEISVQIPELFTAEELEKTFQGNVHDAISEINHKKPSRPQLSVKKPVLKSVHTSQEAMKYTEELVVYEQAEKMVRDFENQQNDELEKYIREVSGFNRIVPKDRQSKVWSKAWSDGHAYNLYEVYQELVSLVELFED